MNKEIKKVAVLGAGVMGSQIAAHLSNAGIPSLLFDLNQELAEKGLQMALKLKPAPFYNPKTADLIELCNYDDHLDRLGEADWVIEAIAERLDWKQQLFKRIEPTVKKEAFISSNTSGLLIDDMTKDVGTEFKRRFLVTHFFNPPRYMHLLEIITGKETDPAIVAPIVEFCENVLGKGIVYAKETVNFIANRIGVYNMMVAMDTAKKMRLTIEEVDKLTGPIVGRPKSATFRTADVVGLDTLAHVAQSSYDYGENDEERDMFKIPDYFQKLLDKGWIGQKVKSGFYKKVDKEILSIDLDTLEYKAQKKVRFSGYKIARSYLTTAEKIKALVYSDDKAGAFSWEVMARTLIYTANRIPEIADDIVNVDRAMRWGFGWELGPFQIWDAIGVDRSVRRMENEGKKVPAWVKEMLASGRNRFYEVQQHKQYFYAVPEKDWQQVPVSPRVLNPRLEGIRLRKNWGASIYDIGDGVAFLDIHSVLQPQMNPIDASILDMLAEALPFISDSGMKALVIGSQGPNFSAGANLDMILTLAKAKRWKELEQISKTMQDAIQNLKYAPFPVVSAPFNVTLGGGFEVMAGTDRVVASAELYCGAVEVGVGLIPGAGGNLRILLNFMQAMEKGRPGPFPPVQKAFETIGFARVSSSAKEAVKLGYMKKSDQIVINPDHLIYEAKQAALELAESYRQPQPREDIILPGRDGFLVLKDSLNNFVKKGVISNHDRVVGEKLAWVLTGGERANSVTPVSEQYLLDIEREAFVSLCGEKLSQDRMEYMLKTGKPLRN
ncbi:MAG TPA: 3-hydroxyacyl-CoA dehydrogenase/enoyl-CoA hydratase family protein [Caldithrix abyssi]|uniref:3-hydroxyacyl-CoA dehydrogenase/enoyl-CoA hydratase family protein n=1 Tax=Caldithrix abyssi TaxID=187145 RepID=A0A7V4U293_CALAY|nr:3-hydroxyacyl-CoA dehydrogenase/enoyl-CoA hydratase family protein [Caldithrix abyssi]